MTPHSSLDERDNEARKSAPAEGAAEHRRILIVDDNASLHEDYRKILTPQRTGSDLEDLEASLFGETKPAHGAKLEEIQYELDSAYQGGDALEMVRRAAAEGNPYALIFMDVRMPPGWDGIQTTARIWNEFPNTEVVICTAYSDYSWETVLERLGFTDRLLFLKKPFDSVAVKQMALSLVKKWNLRQQSELHLRTLEDQVRQRTEDLRISIEQLKSLNASHECVVESLPLLLIVTDPEDRVFRINKKAEETLNLCRSASCDKLFTTLPIEWDWPAVRALLKRVKETNLQQSFTEVRYSLNGRDNGILDIAASPITDSDGIVRGTLWLAQEVTEKNQLKEQLIRGQKLEAIGQLAAGIAHEINTPLQYIGDNTRFCQDALQGLVKMTSETLAFLKREEETGTSSPSLEELRKAGADQELTYFTLEAPRAVEEMLDGVAQVSTIVKAMKEFAHPGNDQLVATDLTHAIKNTLTMSRGEWRNFADVELKLEEGLPSVLCYPSRFNQAFLNLIVNASQAIEQVVENSGKKGQITIEARHQGPWVEIRVSDTGKGVPPEIRDKIFDHFFTTKAVGKGSGQGLSFVHTAIVSQLGGTVEFDSVENEGTTFTLKIPLQPNQIAENVENSDGAPAGSE